MTIISIYSVLPAMKYDVPAVGSAGVRRRGQGQDAIVVIYNQLILRHLSIFVIAKMSDTNYLLPCEQRPASIPVGETPECTEEVVDLWLGPYWLL